MQLKFKQLREGAELPIYATEGAAGMDLAACIEKSERLLPGECAIVPTGVAVEVPDGYEAQIRGRSGLAFKHAIFGYIGTIDSDYRGEIMVLLKNFSKAPFIIEPGMRVGQMVVNAAVVRCRPEFVDELSETKRGDSGFGSTGLRREAADPRLTRKSDMGYIPYTPDFGDASVDQEEIKDKLLNAANKGL